MALLALSATSFAATIVGGGKLLNKLDPNFQSNKIITGSNPSDNNYQFTFEAGFTVCDVTVRMEDETGKEITPSSTNGMYSITVSSAVAGFGNPQVKALSPNKSTDRIDLNPQVPSGTGNMFTVTVGAKSTASAVKFSLSFSTKPPAQSVSCTNLARFDAGTAAIGARPILQSTAGLLLPIRNTGVEAMNFARFELVGTMPSIDTVTIPNKSFTIQMDGDFAFYLVGDEIDPAETIEVFIEFSTPTTNRGALIVTATGS